MSRSAAVVSLLCLTVCNVSSELSLLEYTACHPMIHSMVPSNTELLQRLMPTVEFASSISPHIARGSDVVLVDVDKHTWKLFINHVASWRRSGSDVLIYAIAYDDDVCHRLNTLEGVLCYYDADWVSNIVTWFENEVGHAMQYNIHKIMLGRMMTSLVTVCMGFNTFLTDTDIFFFRDPFDHMLWDADIMVTATAITNDYIHARELALPWGGHFLSDHPEEYITLNNGVVYYRATETAQRFLLSLAVSSARSLDKWGFLQTAFNIFLKERELQLLPYG